MRGLEKRVRPVENNASSAGSLGTKRAIAPTSVRSGDGKVSIQVTVQIILCIRDWLLHVQGSGKDKSLQGDDVHVNRWLKGV